jgi:predicted NUDIX family NTP pyrophosphohydrolase
MKQSSGTLLYRPQGDSWEVLIVHASGWYNKNKPWSIPKGIPDERESLEDTARRETLEETGVRAGTLVYLGHVTYTKSRKEVHCYAGPASSDEPHCASWEVDQACFKPLDDAKELLHPEQRAFIDRLEEQLRKK